MRRLKSIMCAAIAIATMGIASTASAATDAACEIHFWASPVRSAAIYRGSAQLSWQGLSFVNRQMTTALPQARLAEIILETDFKTPMKLTAVSLFEEKMSSEVSTAWEARVRATPSTAPCYYEFQVTYLDYREDILVGRKITTGFIVTDYSGKKPVRASIKTSTSAPIDIFSIGIPALRRVAEDAFRNNLNTFIRDKLARRR